MEFDTLCGNSFSFLDQVFGAWQNHIASPIQYESFQSFFQSDHYLCKALTSLMLFHSRVVEVE